MRYTQRHLLLHNDLDKWGCRVFNLTVGEVLDEFDMVYRDAHKHAVKYFKDNKLPLNMKTTFDNTLYDYSIMLEE